jgi:hypothetical protein
MNISELKKKVIVILKYELVILSHSSNVNYGFQQAGRHNHRRGNIKYL